MNRLLPRLAIVSLLAAPLAAAPAEAPAEAAPPPLEIVEILVTPERPAADTLCRLRVKIRNSGDRIASRLGFSVAINGQELVVYGNQLFLYPVAPGATQEVALYNFWTTESSRPQPADGKLAIEVRLEEAVWTERSTETDEEGEIEVWTPIGPVDGLPVAATLTLQMAGG